MQQIKRTRKMWRASVGIVAFALAVVAIWMEWPRERLLTEVARPMTQVDTETDQLCWLSSTQLLRVTTEQEADYARARNGYRAAAYWQGSADLLDTTTHTKKHLTALTNLLKQTTQFPLNAPYSFETSPDGEWVLWEAYNGGHGLPYSRLAHLDGSHYRGWNWSRVRDKFFLDFSHLVQLTDDEPVMTVCDLLEPTKDKPYKTPEQAKSVLTQYAVRQPVLVTVPSPQDEETSLHAEIDTYRTEDRIRLILSSRDEKQQTPLPVHTVKVKLPEGATMRWSNVSPHQQSVCYHLRREHTNAVLVCLHRFIPKLHIQSTPTEDVWVSRADGGGLREIGYVPARVDDSGSPDDLLEEIRWLPDSKQISFVYRGMLYVVPAVPGK